MARRQLKPGFHPLTQVIPPFKGLQSFLPWKWDYQGGLTAPNTRLLDQGPKTGSQSNGQRQASVVSLVSRGLGREAVLLRLLSV